jgi:hypothetical protein
VKRSDYDRTRPKFNASTNTRFDRPKPPPTATPKPSQQPPPRPDTRTQDEARAQAESNRRWQEEARAQAEEHHRRQDEARAQGESNKKRQEWLNFEKWQEQQIRQCQNAIKPYEVAIAALNAKIDKNRTMLANDVPYVWNVFSFMKTRLSEEEKNEIRLASIQAETVIRIKQIPLDIEKAKLRKLKEELAQKSSQEDLRLSNERADKERKERAAKERAERARQREKVRLQEEQEAKDRVAREASERARQEYWKAEEARMKAAREAQEARNKAAREAAERLRQQQRAAQEARDKAAERERREHWKRRNEDLAKQQAEEAARQKEHERQQKAEQKRRRRAAQAGQNANKSDAKARKPTTKSSGACTHEGWWSKVQGRQECTYCTATLYKFAQQCPDCGTTSCDACRRILQAGGTPVVDPSRHHEPMKSAKGRGRPTSGKTYQTDYRTHNLYTKTRNDI